jgi:hypothetical protein
MLTLGMLTLGMLAIIIIASLIFFLTLYLWLLYHDSKVLGMSIKTTRVLAIQYFERHVDFLKHPNMGVRRCRIYWEKHLLLNRDTMIFLSTDSLTVRFLLYFFSPSSFDLWVEKQKKICLSRLCKFSKMIDQKLTNLFEDACDFWIYIQDLVRNKTHYRECSICCRMCPVIVSECGHCACIQCFEKMRKCQVCRTPINHSKLMQFKDALQIGSPVFT